MTDIVDTEAKTRAASKKIFVIELFDNEGKIIPNASEANIRILKEYKKIDETIVDVAREHPNAFFVKL